MYGRFPVTGHPPGPGGDTADERDEANGRATPPDPDEETAEFGPEALPFAVVTVANGQRIEEDAAGTAVVGAIEREGNAVSTRELVTPAYDGVQSTLST